MVVGASKILTVSYGTFSCTLEGFDEPFGMMKAIAEYFRDLAAEDRYFGAEPPQPDSEMLHRIARQEMRGRIEAKVDGAAVTLRATPEAAAPAPGAAIPEETPGPVVAPEPSRDPAPLAVHPEPAPVVASASDPAVPANDAVAAKLERIRMAVAEARAAMTRTLPETAETPIELAQIVDPDSNGMETTEALLEVLEAPSEELQDEVLPFPEDIAAQIEDMGPASESIAASAPAPEDGIVEDAALDRLIAEVIPEAVEPLTDTLQVTQLQGTSSLSHGQEAELWAELVAAEVEENLATAPTEPVNIAPETPLTLDAADHDTLEFTAADPVEDVTYPAAAEAEIDESRQPQDEAPQALPDDAVPEPAVAKAEAAPVNAERQPLPEADLGRLLDETEAHLTGNENQRRISAIAHLKAAVASTIADRLSLGRRKDRPEEHAAQSMQEPETSIPEEPEPRPAPLVLLSELRIDRNPVVASPAEATPRPECAAPTVAGISPQRPHFEQLERRISAALERDTAKKAQPVAEVEDFARFALSHGSHGLDDLLEAAAAYTAQVEGLSHFSPPDIMGKLSAVAEEAEFSQEERLKVFGRLLRQGKIAKIKPGQYTITEASRYYRKRA